MSLRHYRAVPRARLSALFLHERSVDKRRADDCVGFERNQRAGIREGDTGQVQIRIRRQQSYDENERSALLRKRALFRAP